MNCRILFIAFVIISTTSFAQKVEEGDLKFLKGQTALKVEFTYDDIIVGDEMAEKKYVESKVTLWNEKEDGKGDQWKEMWYSSREDILEPAFRKTLAETTGLSTKVDTARYTLIFNISQIEPGWSGGVIGCVGIVSGEAWFVESSNPTKILAKIKAVDMRGKDYNGGDFEFARRVRQAYVTAAKFISWPINRVKKKKG
jgi:hypothetical protein